MNASSITGKRDFSELYADTTSEDAPKSDSSTLPYTISSSALAEEASSRSDRSSPELASGHSEGEYVPLSRKMLETYFSPSKLNQLAHQGFMNASEGSPTVLDSAEKQAYDSDLESEEEEPQLSMLDFESEDQSLVQRAKKPHSETGPTVHFESPWQIDEARELSADIKEIPSTTHLENYLKLKGVTRSMIACGSGSCGKVYEATISGYKNREGELIPYLYKVEKHPFSLAQWGAKPQRYSDLAAARLDDLPHLIKPLFLIVQVRVSTDTAMRRFYVPIAKAKEFGNALPTGAEASIISQIVPKAPGKNLGELLNDGKISFDPQDQHGHFKIVLLALTKFLKNAYPHNFIHRDLKPENIMYDPDSRTVTIIDTGLALRLRSRGKEDEIVKGASNPTTSKQHYGTPDYRSPFVLRPNGYGSEIDFHSMALVALSLLCNDDFEVASQRRLVQDIATQKSKDILFRHIKPGLFLEQYLGFLPSESETSRILKANPEVQHIIELSFQISAGGPEGEAALREFEMLPYFQEA